MYADSFHRLAKSLLDSGESNTIEEALDTFRQYGIRLLLSAKVRNDKAAQTIALTVINTAARSFMGNVAVESEDFVLTAPGFVGWTLHDFMRWAGIQTGSPPSRPAWPRICIGEDPAKGSIVPWAKGWRFGLGAGGGGDNFFAPACVAAGGLAVSEAFSILRADNPRAGHRNISLSLWNPVDGSDFSPAAELIGPVEGLWLVGLGHLGQAYAWTLGFMNAGQAPLFLQDVDYATVSSLSTSILCTNADVGKRKTRIAATWLESRGYKIALVERHFNEHMRVGPSEPTVALFGVDNPVARRACEAAGFRLIVDAGLGSGYRDFRGIRIRTFPGPSRAAQIWSAGPQDHERALAPAYQSLLDRGVERCGVTTLARRAVGAPFVGCVAAAYVIAEYVRRQQDAPELGFLDMNLRDPTRAEAG